MGAGNYDHPSYITRQNLFLGRTTAGAGGTSILYTPITAMRIRTLTAGVITAGTVVGTGVGAAGPCVSVQVNGSLVAGGTVALSTNAKGVFGTTADLNYACPAGGTLSIVNGTDATLVATVQLEYHNDPVGTWLGNG